MLRTALVLSLVGFAGTAGFAIAQTAPVTPSSPSAGNAIVKPQEETSPAPTNPRRSRVISPEVAAQLSAATPQFAPTPPKPPPTPEEEQPDLRDIDKPKNGIIRLPKVVVHEKPPAVFSDKMIYTQKGLAGLAVRRYMSETDRALNGLTLPFFGSSIESRALMMYEEDQRLKNMSDLNEDARMISATDKAAGAYVKREATKATLREGDFDWHPIGR
jgi:hypothetical protein